MHDFKMPPRQFLAWRRPGSEDEEGRVELIPAGNINEPDYHFARTAETVTIPAGSVLVRVEEKDDSLVT